MSKRFDLSSQEKSLIRRTALGSELEFRIFDHGSDSLSLPTFRTIVDNLLRIATRQETITYLNTIFPVKDEKSSSYRLTTKDASLSVIKKTRLTLPADTLKKSLNCFSIRLNESRETEASLDDIQDLRPSFYRQITRYKIDVGKFSYDCSIISSSSTHPDTPGYNPLVTYEIELELPLKGDLVEFATQGLSLLIDLLYEKYSPPDNFIVKDLAFVIADLERARRLTRRPSRGGEYALSFRVDPINLKRDHLPTLKDFAMTNKLDGERKFLIGTGRGDLMVVNPSGYKESNPNSVYYLPTEQETPELILDTEYYRGRFYVFDVVHLSNIQIDVKTTHQNRMAALVSIGELMKQQNIQAKKFFYSDTQSNLKQFMSENPATEWYNTCDGLIFTEKQGSYSSTRHYKFKFVSKMSIDFLPVKASTNEFGQNVYYLHVSGAYDPTRRAPRIERFMTEQIITYADLAPKVYECVFADRWIILRSRDDKEFPNSLRTAGDVFQDIKHPITFAMLTEGESPYEREIEHLERHFMIDHLSSENRLLRTAFDLDPIALHTSIIEFVGLKNEAYNKDLFGRLVQAHRTRLPDQEIVYAIGKMTNENIYKVYGNEAEADFLTKQITRFASRFFDARTQTAVDACSLSSLSLPKAEYGGVSQTVLQKNLAIRFGQFSSAVIEKDAAYKNYKAVEDHTDPENVVRISQYSSLMPWHKEQVTKVMRKWVRDGQRIADMTANVGIDSIHNASLFPASPIDAYEIEPTFYEALVSNVKGSRVKAHLGDSCYEAYNRWTPDKYDVVYMDAPWGGKDYASKDKLDLYLQAESESVKSESRNVAKVAQYLLTRGICKVVILKVPSNYNMNAVKKFTTETVDISSRDKISYRLIRLLPLSGPAFTEEDVLLWSIPYVDVPRRIVAGKQKIVIVRLPLNLIQERAVMMFMERHYPALSTYRYDLIDERKLVDDAKAFGYHVRDSFSGKANKYIILSREEEKKARVEDEEKAQPLVFSPMPQCAPIARMPSQPLARPPPRGRVEEERDTFYYMRKYHNVEKRTLIMLYCQKKSVLDLGAGFGGDLQKYTEAGVTRLVMVEPNLENIKSKKPEGLEERLNYMQIKDRSQIINTVGQDTNTIVGVISQTKRVEVVSSFFSMTFLFQSRHELRNFLNTVNSSLVEGGYFIGTMMDGDKTMQAMRGAATKTFDKAEIVKKYNDTDEKDTGRKLWINIENTIVRDQDEYLAFFPILQEELEAMGFVLELRYDFDANRSIDAKQMSPATKQFSSLNIAFVFRKMPKQIYLPIERLLVGENQAFTNLYGESTPMYRSGVAADGSCFYHAFMYSVAEEYREEEDNDERKRVVAGFRRAFSDWLTLDKYMKVLPFHTHFFIEQNLISVEDEEPYHAIVSAEYSPDFPAQFRRLSSELRQKMIEGLEEMVVKQKALIADPAQWTEDTHIALFMDFSGRNIYVFSSESRTPTHLLMPYYKPARKESIMMLSQNNDHYEPLAFGIPSERFKRVMKPFDPQLIYLHQWLIKKNHPAPPQLPVSPPQLPVKPVDRLKSIIAARSSFSKCRSIPSVSGLFYCDHLSIDQRGIARQLDSLPWKKVSDSANSRRVQQFGYVYNYAKRSIAEKTDPIPPFLLDLKKLLTDICIDMNIISDDYDFNQCLVNEYQADLSHGISAHKDDAAYGPVVAAFTIGSGAEMLFKRGDAVESIYVKPDSLYIMSGDARDKWTHEMPGRKSDMVDGKKIPRGRRISVTFRNVPV